MNSMLRHAAFMEDIVMQIKVNNKEIELKFGIKMIRELNNIAGMDVNGAPFGMAIAKVVPELRIGDPSALSDVIYAATATVQMGRPSRDDIDDFVEENANEKMFDEVTAEMDKANALKAALKNMRA